MAFTRITDPTNNISSLANQPVESASTLKQKFDQIGEDLKDYTNNTLLPELEKTTDGDSGADNIGATPLIGGTANTVQGILEELNTKDGTAVRTVGNQTINDEKTFTSSPQVPNPDSASDAANKNYVDASIAGVILGQIPDGSLGDVKLSNDPSQLKSQALKKSMFTALNTFIIGGGVGSYVVKTLEEIKTLLGLGDKANLEGGNIFTGEQLIKELTILPDGGDGGLIRLRKPASGTNLDNDIRFGISGDNFIIYKLGGDYKGVKLPILPLETAIGSELITSTTGTAADSDKVRGLYPMFGHPSSGSYIPALDSGGVLEIGRYIDFHKAGNANDFDGRLALTDSNELSYTPFNLQTGILVNTANANEKLTQFVRKDIETARYILETFILGENVSGANLGGVNNLEIRSPVGTGDAFMSFHNAGTSAVHFGLDRATGDLFVGGWSMGAVKKRIYGEHNYDTLRYITGSITLDNTYNNTTIYVNTPNPVVITVPPNLDATFKCNVINYVAGGTCTFLPSGSNIYSNPDNTKRTLNGNTAMANLRIALNGTDYFLVGNLKA